MRSSLVRHISSAALTLAKLPARTLRASSPTRPRRAHKGCCQSRASYGVSRICIRRRSGQSGARSHRQNSCRARSPAESSFAFSGFKPSDGGERTPEPRRTRRADAASAGPRIVGRHDPTRDLKTLTFARPQDTQLRWWHDIQPRTDRFTERSAWFPAQETPERATSRHPVLLPALHQVAHGSLP